MSVVSRSYEDQVEVTEERVKDEPVQEEVGIIRVSPRYKGKHPKTLEQLAAEREARKVKRVSKHYQSDDPAVNPNHYKSKSGLEAIDFIEAFTEDLPGYEAYLAGSAMKYLCRYRKKNGLTDVEKSAWFVNELIKHLKTQEGA